jgi:hypothetical protein
MQQPLPSFAQTRSLLTLRETQLANSTHVGDQTALYSHDNGGACGQDRGDNRSGYGNYGGNNTGGNRTGGRNYYRKKKTGGGGNTSGGHTDGNHAGNPGGNRTAPPAPAPPASGPWAYFNPYTGQPLQLQPPAPRPISSAGLLGPRIAQLPLAQAFTSLALLHGQAYGTNPPPTPAHHTTPAYTLPAWDCSALITALNNDATPSTIGEWVMDSGATAHMAPDPGMLHYSHPSPSTFVTVGNGSTMPTSYIGHVSLPAFAHTFSLNNVLIVPNLVKNLISICCFTIDNWCSIEFDPFGFSVKDLRTKAVITRCSSLMAWC